MPRSRLPWKVVALALGTFLAISYVLCIVYGLLVPPERHMHPVWAPLLPGFEWLSWGSFFLGLVEAFFYGVYIAALYCPLHNGFARLLNADDRFTSSHDRPGPS